MDADIYEHLNTTITQSPTTLQNVPSANPPVSGPTTAETVANEEETNQNAPAQGDSSMATGGHRARATSVTLPEEIDQVMSAIVTSPWATRLNSLVGSVRKQGESVLETTKVRASREFDNMRSGLASLGLPSEEKVEANDAVVTERGENDPQSAVPPVRVTASSMFSYLKSTADAAQKKLSPALRELSKAEDVADAYLNRLGSNFGQMLRDVVTINPPDESASETNPDDKLLFDMNVEKKKRSIHTSRTDAVFHELHTSPELFLKDPDPSTDPNFPSWESTFSAEKHTEQIAQLLDQFPDLRNLMDALVPEKVSYSDFWKRYLYRREKINASEARRKQLFENKHDDNEFDWEDGDDDTDAEPAKPPVKEGGNSSPETLKKPVHDDSAPRKSSTSESSTSFDVVSLSSANPLAAEKVATIPDESDDDWE